MLETIQVVEQKVCGDCALWRPFTPEEHHEFELNVEEHWGVCVCANIIHKSKASRVCLFPNSFCSIKDYNCETCSRINCPLYKQGNKSNGCVNEWRHQFKRYRP